MNQLEQPSEWRPAAVMHCDDLGCLDQVKRAPRILVPNCHLEHPELLPLRIMTTLHYCERHRHSFKLEAYWSDRVRARAEITARAKWNGRGKLDFEAATVEMVLVTTPEYRAFMRDLGVNVIA